MDGYCYQLIMIQIRNILQYLIFMVDLELHMGNLSSMKCRSGPERVTLSCTAIPGAATAGGRRLPVVAGREVVQLYFGAPQGLLGKPAKALCGYQKTRLLQPGESQLISIETSAKDLASYDDLGRICKSAWILEKGSYGVSLRCLTSF